LIKSSQGDPPAKTVEEYWTNVALNEAATSMQQSAKWGMHAIQLSFPQLKDRFIYKENGERKNILKMMILLNNLCAQRVGINQIKNVYMRPALRMSMQMICSSLKKTGNYCSSNKYTMAVPVEPILCNLLHLLSKKLLVLVILLVTMIHSNYSSFSLFFSLLGLTGLITINTTSGIIG
jgi:hypothetical protein